MGASQYFRTTSASHDSISFDCSLWRAWIFQPFSGWQKHGFGNPALVNKRCDCLSSFFVPSSTAVETWNISLLRLRQSVSLEASPRQTRNGDISDGSRIPCRLLPQQLPAYFFCIWRGALYLISIQGDIPSTSSRAIARQRCVTHGKQQWIML